jgi:hypothetical protein
MCVSGEERRKRAERREGADLSGTVLEEQNTRGGGREKGLTTKENAQNDETMSNEKKSLLG